MGLIVFLIVFPLIAALVCYLAPNQRLREGTVYIAAGVIALASIILAAGHLTGGATYYEGHSHAIDWIFFAVDLALCAYVMWRSLNAKRNGIFALACVQALMVCMLEFGAGGSVTVTSSVYIDTLSSIMVLIIGIIGSGICVYAAGYMRDFQHHQDELAAQGKEAAPDRQNLFFAVMFAFLAAMFGLVLFNDMAWMLTMWEATTVCSFFLIGYTQTQEATNNAFRQIWMNLLGGIAFSVALIFIAGNSGVMELDRFVSLGLVNSSVALLPLALLAFAALTKAAQMPFHTWLLGAMVAPTPTSALLHSSTMVKAGVFLLIRLSPLMGTFLAGSANNTVNPVAVAVMLVGCTTFLLCSFMAISQTNAKRVLAYSTIANLGLIVTCAGVGTPEAVWAAIFLLIFHAAAKSLLFLCVGTAEHHIGSRDIESMDALVSRMPRLACLMALGICGMFVAPFGMLISKWAALGAFVDSNIFLLIIMLAFGSAATFFFWAKWLGKIMCNMAPADNVEKTVHKCEWVALFVMSSIVALACVLLPLISQGVVAPYVLRLVGGVVAAPSATDLTVMAIMALIVILLPLAYITRARTLAKAAGDEDAQQRLYYMNGVALPDNQFSGSLGAPMSFEQRNWYLEKFFSEEKLSKIGTYTCLLIALCGIACAMVLSFSSNLIGSVI